MVFNVKPLNITVRTHVGKLLRLERKTLVADWIVEEAMRLNKFVVLRHQLKHCPIKSIELLPCMAKKMSV